MKAILKRSVVFALALALAVGAFAGCKRTPSKITDYASTVVATYGDENIYLDEANFYARLQQYYSEAIYSSYYGEDFWSMDVSGKTLEASTKENVMAAILQTRVLIEHAGEYNVSLTEEDKEKVKKTAAEFFSENEKSLKEAVNLTEERLYEILEKNALAMKVWAAVVADVDTNVPEEEARQVTVKYILIKDKEDDVDYAKNTADSLVERMNSGESIDDIAAADDSFTVNTASYTRNDPNATGLAAVAAPMATDENKTGYIEGTGAYAIHCVTDFDKDKTEQKKESVIEARKDDLFEKAYAGWKDSIKEFKVVDEVWDQIVFEGKPIFSTEAATEPSKESAPESSSETGSEPGTESSSEGTDESSAQTNQ